MARLRSKPDFNAGFITWIDDKPLRALELCVRGDDLYAIQPKRGRSQKTSYHSSGQFHIKVGDSAPILPTADLPPRFIKEYARHLGHDRRRLFTISLENALSLLPYTGQEYDKRVDLHVPKIDGLAVLELYLGNNSGQRARYEIEGYLETTVTERMFEGANYEFSFRLAVLTANGGYTRPFDHEISSAWLTAGRELGFRVSAPSSVQTFGGDALDYEAYLPDFGFPNGIVVGIVGRDDGDLRRKRGYAACDLSGEYRHFNRTLFIDTLNDWGWFAKNVKKPEWYTGKSWTS